MLCGLVIREIWRPELDAVRQTYGDDPDGGVLNLPDAGWVGQALRRAVRLGTHAEDRQPRRHRPEAEPAGGGTADFRRS